MWFIGYCQSSDSGEHYYIYFTTTRDFISQFAPVIFTFLNSMHPVVCHEEGT
jgi:hypothetical protein